MNPFKVLFYAATTVALAIWAATIGLLIAMWPKSK